MLKTLNPYTVSDKAKQAEIMSRYRPIAPKPEGADEANSMETKINQSPYLKNVWPQMQARPTRTRKRGRVPISPSSFKRQRPVAPSFGFATPSHYTSAAKTLSLQSFVHGPSRGQVPLQVQIPSLPTLTCGFNQSPVTTASSSIVTVPLLPCSPSNISYIEHSGVFVQIPQEMDLLQQLQRPVDTNVFAPQPIKPVSSTIKVGCISEDPNPAYLIPKSPKEVEAQMESEPLPTVVSDSSNKVRMTNSAYKEMVGQPECSWLESLIFADTSVVGASPCKRIGGEVMLEFSGPKVPTFATNGFCCWVRIEWGDEERKCFVNAFCDVIRLYCGSKDYLFTWRFHTQTREVSEFSSSF